MEWVTQAIDVFLHLDAHLNEWGITWVALFVIGGHMFAELRVVKDQFHVVIVAIIAISLLPPVIEYWRARR